MTQLIAAADLAQPGAAAGVPVTISANFSGTQTPNNFGAIAVSVKGIPGPALPVNVDLYLDGAFIATLATVPAGLASFDVPATPGIVIPAGKIVNIVIDLSAWSSGNLNDWLLAFAVVPT